VNTQYAAASYNQVKNHSAVEHATSHQLIDMLFDGVLERISQAKGAMQYKNIELKGTKINAAINIVSGLRENLNKDEGGELAENLDDLYIYIMGILSKAHTQNKEEYLDEAAILIGNIHSAWKQIA